MHANPVASVVNRTNPIASAANLINSDVNDAGCTNIVNHRELSAHSIGSVDRFDPSALFRKGEAACIKLKPDIYDGSASFSIQSYRPREPLGRGNKDHWFGLRGKARAVLESMQNLENLQFEELKSKLEMRFGETPFVIKLLFAIY